MNQPLVLPLNFLNQCHYNYFSNRSFNVKVFHLGRLRTFQKRADISALLIFIYAFNHFITSIEYLLILLRTSDP